MSTTISKKPLMRNRRTRGSTQRSPDGPGVTVRADGRKINAPVAKLGNPAIFEQIAVFCREADVNPGFVIRDLPAWPNEARWLMLQTIAQLERPYAIRMGNDGQQFDNLFAAVLHIAEGPASMERSTNCLRAAVETAALKHPDCLEAACQRIVTRFRKLGQRGLRTDSLMRQARNILGTNSDAADPSQLAADFCNQVGNASDVTGEPALRYFQDEFFVWEGDHYQRADAEDIEARLTRFLQAKRPKLTGRFVRDVLVNLKGLAYVNKWHLQLPLWIPDETDGAVEPSPFIAFANGLVSRDELLNSEAKELTLQPHDVRNFSEIVLPYEYDAKAECPLWKETLNEIFPDLKEKDRRIKVLQEFTGYTLIPHDTTFEKFMILVGDGANGKSTILNVLGELLGRQNVSHVPLEALGSEFLLNDMRGRLANIAADMNRMDKVQEGLLKALTSGDPMQVNRKNKEPITMRPTARLIFATNTLPPIADRSEGIWRRMIAMPFYENFGVERRDRNRATNLLKELPGIFNWALAGARRLYRKNRFSECTVCQACIEDHRHNSDPFRQFVEECVNLGTGGESKHDVYDAYCKFCEDNGRKPRNSSEFGKQILELDGVKASREGGGSRRWLYSGVKLRPASGLRGL